MADVKISNLANLAAAADDDELVIVDVSAGITKKIEALDLVNTAHTHDGETLQIDGINSNGGAFPFTTSGDITLTQSLVMANGKGIDFSAHAHAAGMTSELLDDYEEGTWTPVPADAQTGGNTGSAGTALGLYTKIGNIVIASVQLINIDTTGLTAGNNFYIQGLPFAPHATIAFTGSVRVASVTFTGFVSLYTATPAAALFLVESASGAALDFIIVSEVADDAGDILGVISYRVG